MDDQYLLILGGRNPYGIFDDEYNAREYCIKHVVGTGTRADIYRCEVEDAKAGLILVKKCVHSFQ